MGGSLASLLLLLSALLLSGALALCPDPSTLRNVDGVRVCARFYRDSNVLYDRCCSGGFFDVVSPADVASMGREWNDRISSLVVGPRCQLTVWNKRNKLGYRRTFRTGIQYRLVESGKGLFGNWDNSISSYYCTCS
ncbi:syncollin-like [Carcharodon carcharias]|uniref:syncollin-like n=1 Tax=Carcharodon carcharias TaxID=13397 RepID=UPI001B7DE478|nr:syncollin-like [Carcharodon carcharias]